MLENNSGNLQSTGDIIVNSEKTCELQIEIGYQIKQHISIWVTLVDPSCLGDVKKSNKGSK